MELGTYRLVEVAISVTLPLWFYNLLVPRDFAPLFVLASLWQALRATPCLCVSVVQKIVTAMSPCLFGSTMFSFQKTSRPFSSWRLCGNALRATPCLCVSVVQKI